MIVLLAVFVLMVVIGALADRSRRKKEAAALQPQAEVSDPVQAEPEAGPAPIAEVPQSAPVKVTVHRRTVRPAAVIPASPVVPVGPDSAQDVTARLRRAQQMYTDGVISRHEYKRIRRRILDDI